MNKTNLKVVAILGMAVVFFFSSGFAACHGQSDLFENQLPSDVLLSVDIDLSKYFDEARRVQSEREGNSEIRKLVDLHLPNFEKASRLFEDSDTYRTFIEGCLNFSFIKVGKGRAEWVMLFRSKKPAQEVVDFLVAAFNAGERATGTRTVATYGRRRFRLCELLALAPSDNEFQTDDSTSITKHVAKSGTVAWVETEDCCVFSTKIGIDAYVDYLLKEKNDKAILGKTRRFKSCEILTDSRSANTDLVLRLYVDFVNMQKTFKENGNEGPPWHAFGLDGLLAMQATIYDDSETIAADCGILLAQPRSGLLALTDCLDLDSEIPAERFVNRDCSFYASIQLDLRRLGKSIERLSKFEKFAWIREAEKGFCQPFGKDSILDFERLWDGQFSLFSFEHPEQDEAKKYSFAYSFGTKTPALAKELLLSIRDRYKRSQTILKEWGDYRGVSLFSVFDITDSVNNEKPCSICVENFAVFAPNLLAAKWIINKDLTLLENETRKSRLPTTVRPSIVAFVKDREFAIHIVRGVLQQVSIDEVLLLLPLIQPNSGLVVTVENELSGLRIRLSGAK